VVIREALIHEGETPLLLLLPSLNDSREEWERWVGPCEIYKWKESRSLHFGFCMAV